MKSDALKDTSGNNRWVVRGVSLLAICVGLASLGHLRAEEAAGKSMKEPEPTLAEPLPESLPATATTDVDVKDAAPANPPVAKKAKTRSKSPEEELTADEKQVLDQLNAERQRWGRRPLKINRHLMKAARRHAANMARWNVMSHNLGGNVSQRVAATGVWMRSAGENVAQGQRSPRQVMATWMASSGHRNNILSTGYTDVGIAMAHSSNGTPFWVQVFATP